MHVFRSFNEHIHVCTAFMGLELKYLPSFFLNLPLSPFSIVGTFKFFIYSWKFHSCIQWNIIMFTYIFLLQLPLYSSQHTHLPSKFMLSSLSHNPLSSTSAANVSTGVEPSAGVGGTYQWTHCKKSHLWEHFYAVKYFLKILQLYK